jgi:hypothetical membrane protein
LAIRQRTKFLAYLGLAGVAQFVLSLIALHATSSSEPWHLSDFARSQHAWLWVAGAYSIAVAGIALTLALHAHVPGSLFARAGLALLWLSAVGAVLIATFPTDATPQATTLSGTIHNDAVGPTFTSLGIAMTVMGPALRGRRSWRRFADASVVFGLLVCASGVAYILTDTRGMAVVALVQRFIVALIACWFVLLALNVLAIRPHRIERPAATATSTPSAQPLDPPQQG